MKSAYEEEPQTVCGKHAFLAYDKNRRLVSQHTFPCFIEFESYEDRIWKGLRLKAKRRNSHEA